MPKRFGFIWTANIRESRTGTWQCAFSNCVSAQTGTATGTSKPLSRTELAIRRAEARPVADSRTGWPARSD